jgi:asparagine N-glycosylation enzyme membrane subunit Stt3
MSLIEALANVVVGFWLAVIAQLLVFPLFSLSVLFGQNLAIATLFTGVSLMRGYVLRRLFETLAWQSFLRQTLSHVDAPPTSGSNTRSL